MLLLSYHLWAHGRLGPLLVFLERHPEKGVGYIYLTHENFLKLQEKAAEACRTVEIERRHKITNLIGMQDGLGVEWLKDSGLIASETFRAYNDIFTIALVTARSFGIGAYLVLLGRRAVQVEGQPIILPRLSTRFLVVKSTPLQLGGTQIMYKDDVSHLTAASDLESAAHILKWFSITEIMGNWLPVHAAQGSRGDKILGSLDSSYAALN